MHGSGSRVDPRDHFDWAFRTHAQWPTFAYIMDNLGVNDCVLALERKLLKAMQACDPTSVFNEVTAAYINCTGHTAVLPLQNLLGKGADSASTQLVRMGHLIESSRTVESLEAAIEKLFMDSFCFRLVEQLPEECRQWRLENMNILESSREARDLAKISEEEACEAHNGPPDGVHTYHYCIGESCPVGCKGDEATSKRLCWLRMKPVLCSWQPAPLAYRWKGMAQFLAASWRGRRFHDFLGRGFRAVFDKKRVARAEQELQAAAANPNVDDRPLCPARKQVRGGRVADWMEADPMKLIKRKRLDA